MKVGTRIVFLLVVPIVLVMAVAGWLDQRRSRALLRAELAREGRALALVVGASVEDALRDRQIEDIEELIERIGGYERILGVRVFDGSGKLSLQTSRLDRHPFAQDETLGTVLSRARPVETSRVIDGEPVMEFFIPLTGPAGEPLGAVQLLQLESFIEEDARASRNFAILLTAVMILATASLLLMVAHFVVTKPVEKLLSSFRVVASGDLAARVPADGRDELSRLAREFNRMCEQLERARNSLRDEYEGRRRMQDQIRSMEHLAGIGRLAAGLAHEIGTPLGVIRGRAESLLREEAAGSRTRRNVEIIISQIDRISRIVREVLEFARQNPPAFTSTDVGGVVRKVMEFIEQRSAAQGVNQVVGFPPDMPVIRADGDQLQQVFLNLAINALDAMPEGGRLEISARVAPARHPAGGGGEVAEEPFLAVSVEDTGRGIAPEHRSRVLEPFFTTKQVGAGSGLGLSVSYGIVREHGGWMEIDSEAGKGSRFTVYLPLTRTEIAEPEPAGGSGAP